MDRSYNYWKEVCRNIGKARRVWSRLGKLLRREEAESRVYAMFYRAVVRAVLLFGAETWVLSEEMPHNLEGVHVLFLRQITGQRIVRQRDRTWRSVTSEKFLKKEVTHPLGAYIDKRQATVAEWVKL